jgi:hypothetical protein
VHTPRVTTLYGVMRIVLWLLPFTLACGGAANTPGGDDGSSGGDLCTNTCEFANDGECDDGGPGADFDDCAYGSDCRDCGPRPPQGGTCTCDVTSGCDQGCVCDPDCGGQALGADCSCGGADVCSDTNCASGTCLWLDGSEAYCSQQCGTCPGGFECVDFVGLGSYCHKIETVPACGSCTHSSECESFPGPGGVSIAASCFAGRCRMNCTPGTTACSCVAGTPVGGDAQGFCADDGC